MTTRGTRKFEYTEGLDKLNVTGKTGVLGTPSSGVATAMIAVMVLTLVVALIAH